jgi:hypothetical protein
MAPSSRRLFDKMGGFPFANSQLLIWRVFDGALERSRQHEKNIKKSKRKQ